MVGRDFGITEADLLAIAGVVVGIVNIGLRLVTGSAISVPGTSGNPDGKSGSPNKDWEPSDFYDSDNMSGGEG